MTIAFYFDPSKQTADEHVPGVPAADLDEATFDALPEHLQKDVAASPLYRKTRPPQAATRRAAADEEAT